MTSDEIRERFLSFFEQRGHLRIPSASLVPSAHDPSALLTVAGMHPLKPYFLGQETPPAPRLTDCQKVFRAVDIDNVGRSTSHLTFFEMLGNFSFGDYFKREAIEFAWELSRDVFGFAAEDLWATVFAGDDELGLGPDDEAIAYWRDVGVPLERIVRCGRSENFWQAGPTGPCGPCSELYVDRGVDFGSPDDLPGESNDRFLEYWNLVFMQYDQQITPEGQSRLEPLPAKNIDTGLGLNRLAAILQDKPSVFETDQFWPLIELGQELAGARYGEDAAVDRAMRILADHSRAMTFLVADGVVPSNEERGYVLRRVMRRAIQQGRMLELAPGFLTSYASRVEELMGGTYPELEEQWQAIQKWLSAEEESFGRTLTQGMATLRSYIAQARERGASSVPAAEVFRLHDTYGFPREVTSELLAEEGLTIEGDVDELMNEQRSRSRAGADGSREGDGALTAGVTRAQASSFASGASAPTRFTGYETERQPTTVEAVAQVDGRYLVKLAESPFYAAGGGQISDVGTISCEQGDCRARVSDVFRLGDDQVLSVALEGGELREGEQVLAEVDHAARFATECNHTATHLLHAALRERLGSHVRQAGSYVGPDKLRFDFSHSHALSSQELTDVEDRVNEWIARNDPVRPLITTLAEARGLGAMALFGEKYGDVVRMVEIGDGSCSRELCGGTHVRSTAEIGAFRILSETSSAANVRRIEALTGPVAVSLLREHDRLLEELAAELRTRPELAPDTLREHERERKELQNSESEGSAAAVVTIDLEPLLAAAANVDGVPVLASSIEDADSSALLALVDRLKGKLGDAAIVLGSATGGKVQLVVSLSPVLVQRGLSAPAVIKNAAKIVGGGGGGRDTLAQAGGKDPAKLEQAIEAAESEIISALED
ncbi:MAG TPA: alanine--tRNA ligase [Solirubrobacteraceae bacterium]|jgi:alanyl-tRNA synthetase|nr:alanine--tRNA ligase [Solirubrobacteraceae bacterium]